MGTTADKLNELKQTKANLKAALTEQGQTPGDVLSDYPDLVRAIQTSVTPSISVSSAGLITATAGDKSATKQLNTQAGGTRTPGTSDTDIVYAGQYATGNITMKGDANLVPENIKSGVSIFGVTGTASGGGGYHTSNSSSSSLAAIDASGNLVIQPPTDIDIAKISGVENFGVRIYKSSAANKEYREMLIISFSTEYYDARFLHTFWSGAVSPQSANATLKEIAQSFCEVDFNETTKVLTLTPNDEVSLLDYGDPSIYIRVTYALH